MKVKVKYTKARGSRVTMMETGYAKLLVKLGVVSYVTDSAPQPAPAPKPKKKTAGRKKKAAGEKKEKKPRASRSRKKKSDALPVDAQ